MCIFKLKLKGIAKMTKQLFLVLALSGFHVHAMDQQQKHQLLSGHAMTDAVSKSVRYLEEQALDGGILDAFVGVQKPHWFNGDTKKAKNILHSLLAIPSSDWQATQEAADLQLIEALKEESVSKAAAALDQGANPNCYTERGGTPLSVAIKNVTLVKLLLERRANPSMPYATSWTPLACAMFGSDTENGFAVVKELLEHGARPQISLLGSQANTSCVSAFYVPENCVRAVQFLLTFVHAQDVEPIKQQHATKEQVIADIIETRKFLIALSERKLLWRFDYNEPYLNELKQALSLDKFDEYYKQKITDNVEALLADKKEGKL